MGVGTTTFTVTDLRSIDHLWEVEQQEIRTRDHVNVDQNLSGMFPTPCGKFAGKTLGSSGVQPFTSTAHLLKRPVGV